MSKIIIYAITILGIFLYGNTIENKRLPLNQIARAVSGAYHGVLRRTNLVGTILVRIALCVAIAFIAVFSYQQSVSMLGNTLSYRMGLLTCSLFTILIIVFYYLFGMPLLIFSKIELLIRTTHRKKLSFRFLITCYILFVYAFLLWNSRAAMAESGNIVLLGLAISYALNMTMLINISMEPVTCCYCKYGQKKRIEQKYPLKIVLAGALILILLIVLNLYLGVVVIANRLDNAYVYVGTGSQVSDMDLLYYTVISFTTIGYGEIVPQHFESKMMAIIIAYTSVMCLVIFVSSILALKDTLKS